MSPDENAPGDAEDELEDLEATEAEANEVQGGGAPVSSGWDVKKNVKL